MSHLLIVDLLGGNDTDILGAAIAGGHRFSFLTADPAYYAAQGEVAALLAQAQAVIDAEGFVLPALLARLATAHRVDPYAAILCLQDLRIAETAEIAHGLGLRHLNPETAALCRDKTAVRARLATAGIAQPPFASAQGPAQLVAAAEAIRLPLIIKPADGFGSQNIFALSDQRELRLLRNAPEIISAAPGAYGLGVTAQGSLIVERLMTGQILACDTFSVASNDGVRHMLLGSNQKGFLPAPVVCDPGRLLHHQHRPIQ